MISARANNVKTFYNYFILSHRLLFIIIHIKHASYSPRKSIRCLIYTYTYIFELVFILYGFVLLTVIIIIMTFSYRRKRFSRGRPEKSA